MPRTRLGIAIVPLFATLLMCGQARSEDIKFASMNAQLLEQAQRIDELEGQLVTMKEESKSGKGLESDECTAYGLFGGVEATLLKAHNSALSVDLGGGFASLTPDYNAQLSPRFWLGYQGPRGLGLKATYWGFDQTATGSDIAIAAGGDVSLGLEAHTFDLELIQTGSFCKWDLTASGGLRWARIRNQLSILDPANDLSTVLSRDFEGVGGTVSLGAVRPVGDRGLALIGSLRASLIYGESNLDVNDTLFAIPPVRLTADDQVMPVYDMRLGVQWSREMAYSSQFVAQLAYEAQLWEVPAVAAGVFDSNIGFAGPALSIGIAR